MRHRVVRVIGLACALASAADAAPVRMFAVGHEIRVDDAVTYQRFHDRMAALMDATFPGRSTLVQSGVDDVASHLAPADPAAPANALVEFPEDTGLLAALIGTRGTSSRAQATSVGAIVNLLTPYAPVEAYYEGRWPGQPFVRKLILGLTDTLYRSVYETFRELAMTHHVYLVVAANLAPARRVEAAEDPALVALLRDPDEPTRTYAYEAVSPFPHNTTFVFAPDGEILVPDGSGGTLRAPSQTGGVLRGSTNKAYLVPIEQPPPGNAAGLSLGFGAVRDMEVLDTPVGRLGIAISKDAWMMDVNDRYVAKRANVILQPEAFDSWAFTTTEWSPDVFKEGGFANLQKNPEWVANVDASLTGNFFDVTFDGQSALLGRRTKTSPGPLSSANAWIGQNPDTGFVRIAPWIVSDPGIASPGLSLADRRTALAAAGAPLLPGSGVPCSGELVVGSCEAGYREAIVWADVDVPMGPTTSAVDPVRAAPPRFSASVPVSGAETTPVQQHAPRIAVRGRHVFVVWYEDAGAGSRIRLAISHDHGQSFQPPIGVSGNAPGTATELNPSIAVKGGRIAIVWQEFDTLGNDDSGRIVFARFNVFGRKLTGDVRVDDVPGNGKWMPAVAFLNASSPVVAWIDERDRGPEGEPLEHVYASRGVRGGTLFRPGVRVDQGAPVDLAAHNDNKWAPAIAARRGEVYVAWADFRNANWDVFLARSDDFVATFGLNTRVDDYDGYERLNERPSIGLDPGTGIVHVMWTDLRAREPDTNIFYAQSGTHGVSFSRNVSIDGSRVGFDPDTQTPTNQWAPSIVALDDEVFAVWQDGRLGNDDIFFTSSSDGGASFKTAERVDDTGTGTSEQSRPSLAAVGHGDKRRCHVAWEDTRNGDRDIYVATRFCP